MRLNPICRRLLQLPVFTTVTALTLAIGIGANAAIACGLAVAIALTRLMGSLLFEVSPIDPLTYVGFLRAR